MELPVSLPIKEWKGRCAVDGKGRWRQVEVDECLFRLVGVDGGSWMLVESGDGWRVMNVGGVWWMLLEADED